MSVNRVRVWFSLFVLAVFSLGAAGGFVLGRHARPWPRAGGFPSFDADGRGFGRAGGPGRGGAGFGRGPGSPALRPELANRLTSELQLDASQQAQVKKILEERRDRFEQVHREARDRFNKEQRELHDAIRAVLRPDQQQKFDAFLDRRR